MKCKIYFDVKRRLWTKEQSCFSLAQVRCFWCCLWHSSGFILGMQQLKPLSLQNLCVVLLHQPQSTPFLNWPILTILLSLWSSLLLVQLSILAHFPWRCFDTSLWAARLFSNDLQCLSLLMEDVGGHQMSSQQPSPWFCLTVLNYTEKNSK